MKPLSRRFAVIAFPAMIIVPSLSNAGISANLIYPDAAGDVLVSGDYDETNGSDWTVIANGGSASPYSVKINSGALLTGSPENGNGVEVSTTGYIVENAGSLDVKQFGVTSSVGGTDVLNKAGASIKGGSIGIGFSNRILQGRVSSDAVAVIGNSVANQGVIAGGEIGILSDGASPLVVNNTASGSITGDYGAGIQTEGELTVINRGSILGSRDVGIKTLERVPFFFGGSGISTGSGADITNTGLISGYQGAGITAGSDLLLDNSGTITGLGSSFESVRTFVQMIGSSGIGVIADDNAVITNSGTISGKQTGISAGNNLKLTNEGTISGTNEEGEGGYAGVIASSGATIVNSGTITGDQYGIILNSSEKIIFDASVLVDAPVPEVAVESEALPPSTITNTGTIRGSEAAILLNADQSVVNLDFGSEVIGNIRGSEGTDTLNFLSGSENSAEQLNIVRGSVFGMETINKSQSGFAFIGGPGDSVQVIADTINVSGGGLIINGSLFSQKEGKTQVNLSGGGSLDGTGSWNADITIGSGGLSAGGTSSPLAGELPIVFAKSATTPPPVGSYNSSVGTLTINGNVGASLAIVEPPIDIAPAKILAPPTGLIRVDIRPGTEIINGVNSDLIVHTGPGSTFDLTGLDIQLAPTDINKALTEGKYTIIDSQNPLVGVQALGQVGVSFTGNVPDSGPFRATGSGENDTNTVLTQYFTTIDTEDPVDAGPKPTRIAVAAPVFDPDNSNLVVNIQHDFANLPGLTKNQAALGAVIDGLVANPDSTIQDFIAALDYSDLANVQSTFAALDPGATLGLANSVVNSNYRLHRLTQEHLSAIRGSSKETVDTAPSSKDAKGVITPGASSTRSTGRGNAWGSFSYDGQDNEGAADNADYDGSAGAFTAGVDWLFAPKLAAGLVLDGSKGSYDADNYSSDVDSFRGAAYATYGAATGFYSDALVGFGTHSLESSIGSTGVLLGSTSNDTDADSFQALWTAGYAFGNASLKHGPFGGFEYQKVNVDGYTQGGPLAITVGDYDVESFRALIGYRVNAEFGKFRPYASVAYAHEFEDGANSATATLAGVPFRVSGAEQSSAFIITAGTAYTLTESLTLDLGYRGEIATDDGITSNGGSIGVNYSF